MFVYPILSVHLFAKVVVLSQDLPPRLALSFLETELVRYDISLFAAVEKKFPGDKERLARMSLIEGNAQRALR